jgi:hypothetical protein
MDVDRLDDIGANWNIAFTSSSRGLNIGDTGGMRKFWVHRFWPDAPAATPNARGLNDAGWQYSGEDARTL